MRNNNGRFQKGQSGNPQGRPKGSKNALSEDFVSDFHQAWKEHGPDALERMALERPAEFCKCAAGLIPKDFHIQQNAAEQPQMQIFIREGPLAERFRKAGNEITTLPHRPESTE